LQAFEIALLVLCAVIVVLAAVFLINNRPPSITVPVQKMPKDNGWDDFVKAAEMIENVQHTVPDSPGTTVESLYVRRYELSKRDFAPALNVLRRGFKKPYLHPNDRFVSGTAFSPYSAFRETARVLLGEANYFEQIEQPGGAANSRLDCIEFGVTLPRGGSMITALVGYAIEAMGTDRFARLLPKLNPAELAHVAGRLESISKKRPPYSETVLNQGLTHTKESLQIFRAPGHLKRMLNPYIWYDPDTWDRMTIPRELWDKARFSLANKTALIRENEAYHKEAAAEQQGPYTGDSKVPVPDNALSPVDVVAGRLKYAKGEAVLALIQTEVALRRYHFAHNRYPDKLAQLVPAYVKSVPVDPFGRGKPLKYKPLDGGKDFLLYSRGPNLRDDGGVPGRWRGTDTAGDLQLTK